MVKRSDRNRKERLSFCYIPQIIIFKKPWFIKSTTVINNFLNSVVPSIYVLYIWNFIILRIFCETKL